jgi:two-component system phosphate regulon sensor histidine kinase PhoR
VIQAEATTSNEDMKKFIAISLKQAGRLNRLVEDLLVISKIELGEIKCNFEEASICDAFEGAIPLIEAKAGIKKINIHNNVQENLLCVWADRDRHRCTKRTSPAPR